VNKFRMLSAIALLTATASVPSVARAEPSSAVMAPLDDARTLAVPPLDYADPTSWIAGPAGPGPSAALPRGATPAARDPAADVFFIHPTTDRGGPNKWTMDPRDAAAGKWVDESVVARQASVFSGCCRVFAPRYRAATAAALFNPVMRDKAFDLAYGDVERAFDEFLARYSDGRPFIIAGHSQGSLHAARLLETRIEGTPLQRRLVAAYVVGMNLAEGDFGRRFHHIGICRTPRETGCVVQWNSLLAGSELTKVVAYSQSSFIQKYGDIPGKQTVCVNPLTFDVNRPAAPASASLGAVSGAPGFGPLDPLRSGAVAARCDQGELVVTIAPDLSLDPLPGGGVMRYHDYGLFYADIRANAVLRVAEYLKSSPR